MSEQSNISTKRLEFKLFILSAYIVSHCKIKLKMQAPSYVLLKMSRVRKNSSKSTDQRKRIFWELWKDI